MNFSTNPIAVRISTSRLSRLPFRTQYSANDMYFTNRIIYPFSRTIRFASQRDTTIKAEDGVESVVCARLLVGVEHCRNLRVVHPTTAVEVVDRSNDD